jgi:DGQHR domain-containing protein
MPRKRVTAEEKKNMLVVRALETIQGGKTKVYAFFIKGSDIVRIADLARISREDNDAVKGFQRTEIKSHVKSIVEYLDQGSVLFPNAIILALAPAVTFKRARGGSPEGDDGRSFAGTISIPIYPDGKKVAWIVDGQQRSLALSQTRNIDIQVPVVGFISDQVDTQREQFILVNKARPLPTRLINELLPETTGITLPSELKARRLPSEICNLLNRDPKSPFYELIKRHSDERKERKAVITDTAVITMIRQSIHNPLGALAPFRIIRDGKEQAEVEKMYQILIAYWTAVKHVFPDAWGLDPRHSRLMHSAGIMAMGVLMDRICSASKVGMNPKKIAQELERMKDKCHWTAGHWEYSGLPWNHFQNTARDIRGLQDELIQAYTRSLND